MLRSRSVSSRSALRSVASLLVVLCTLLISSRASADPAVVVTGPDGSARVLAILAELRARGIVAVPEGAATTSTTIVRVTEEGAVTVEAGEHRETFAAAETDSVLARRVAEVIRAAGAEDEPPAAAPLAAPLVTPPPDPPPPPLPPSEPTAAPSRAFARAGTWLLSVDDALPLVRFGASSSPLSNRTVLQLGDPTYDVTTAPKPMSIDYAPGRASRSAVP